MPAAVVVALLVALGGAALRPNEPSLPRVSNGSGGGVGGNGDSNGSFASYRPRRLRVRGLLATMRRYE